MRDSPQYLPGVTAEDYVRQVAAAHPWLAALLDTARLRKCAHVMRHMSTEFDDDLEGRGDSYRDAQRDRDVRTVGITSLLKLAGCGTSTPLVLLDVFGGDGLIADVWRGRRQPDRIITADLSAAMVAAAMRSGLPAVRQPAQSMVLGDSTVDACLMAYGTHHLPVELRPVAFVEAHRVLRPGGRIVVHDFAEASPTADWFSQVVHRHARAGHPYQHFTALGLSAYLRDAGFAAVRVQDCYDPFRLVRATPMQAVRSLVEHIAAMYGLSDAAAIEGWVWLLRLCQKHFRIQSGHLPADAVRHLTVHSTDLGYLAELPRMALVATAIKP